MVFGWGKKKPEQQEDDIVAREKQITLNEIPDIISEIRSIRERTIIPAKINPAPIIIKRMSLTH